MVEILLATYNGAKYLPQQLKSIEDQSNTDWKLLIRDDTSTDETPAIIERFANAHPRRVQVVRDFEDGSPNANLGVWRNFARLLELSKDPYVMFCDQDDVWDRNKIAQSMVKMHEMEKQYGKNTPLLVHTDFSLTDADNNVKIKSHNRARRMHRENVKLNDVLMGHAFWGMSMTMNRPLVEKALPLPTEFDAHDTWVGRVATLTGHIGFVETPLINYRQHGNNVTDNRSTAQRVMAKAHSTGLGSIMDEARLLQRKALDCSARAGEELLSRYGREMTPQQKELISHLAELPSLKPQQRRKTMLDYDILPRKSPRALIGHLVFAGSDRDEKPAEKKVSDRPAEGQPSRGR